MSGSRYSSPGERASAFLFLKPFTLLTAIVVGAALFSAQASARVAFRQTVINSGDAGTFSTVSGDFNNDGILDLVTINAASLSFYKGLGSGKYAAPVNQSLPPNYGGGGPAFAADFNADGQLDLASASGPQCCGNSGGVTILLGNGDGTFQQGTNIAVAGNAATIALADFDGDHKPDIAVSDGQNLLTWIYLGNGDGTFKLSATESYGGNTLVVGDFDADGKQDLALAFTGNVGIFLGKGDGTVSPPILASLSGVASLAVGDFYNSRIPTLVALVGIPGSDYIYSLRYASGQLYVENQTLIGSFSAGGPFYVTGGDLNGDFKFDIFLSGGSLNSGAYSASLLGNGDGTFQTPRNAPANLFSSGNQFPFIRDLNRDSRADVAMAWGSGMGTGGTDVLLNTNEPQNCTPPPANKLRVHICAPTSGQIVGTSFTFKAAGNAFNGIPKRMELWIDNKKVAQNLEDQLNATLSLTVGKHIAAFVVVDSFDNYIPLSVTFTAR